MMDEDDDEKSPTPPPVVPRRSIKDRIGTRPKTWRDSEYTITTVDNKRSRSPEPVKYEANETIKRNKVQPIKFDLTDDERRSSSRELDDHKDAGKSENGKNGKDVDVEEKLKGEKRKSSDHEDHDDEHSKKIKKLQSTRSFDHVPSCKSQDSYYLNPN
jgi:hypothetical protein